MQGHQQKGRQNNTSSINKDKSSTIIETSTAEDHDDENLVVSHMQRIGCQPEKTALHGGQSRSWSAEQGKENK